VFRKGLLKTLVLTAALGLGPAAAANACMGEAKSPAHLTEQMGRQALLCLINERRAHAGRGALQENAALDSSAQGHTVAMVKHNSYSHGDTAHRIRASGYLAGASVWSIGENLAWGPKRLGSPKRIVTEWMHSPEHRRILLGGFHDIGLGMTKGAPFPHFGHNTGTYTVDLASRN
jgi:uncharacterized protein YkwD